MLQNYLIAKLLDMEHMILKEVDSSSNQLVLHVEMERRTCECPTCRTLTSTIHDYRTQRIKDSPIQGKTVVWTYKKRRYRCPCCGKRFYENNYLIPKWHRITNRLALLSMNMLQEKRSRKDMALFKVFCKRDFCDEVRDFKIPGLCSKFSVKGTSVTKSEISRFQSRRP